MLFQNTNGGFWICVFQHFWGVRFVSYDWKPSYHTFRIKYKALFMPDTGFFKDMKLIYMMWKSWKSLRPNWFRTSDLHTQIAHRNKVTCSKWSILSCLPSKYSIFKAYPTYRLDLLQKQASYSISASSKGCFFTQFQTGLAHLKSALCMSY